MRPQKSTRLALVSTAVTLAMVAGSTGCKRLFKGDSQARSSTAPLAKLKVGGEILIVPSNDPKQPRKMRVVLVMLPECPEKTSCYVDERGKLAVDPQDPAWGKALKMLAVGGEYVLGGRDSKEDFDLAEAEVMKEGYNFSRVSQMFGLSHLNNPGVIVLENNAGKLSAVYTEIKSALLPNQKRPVYRISLVPTVDRNEKREGESLQLLGLIPKLQAIGTAFIVGAGTGVLGSVGVAALLLTNTNLLDMLPNGLVEGPKRVVSEAVESWAQVNDIEVKEETKSSQLSERYKTLDDVFYMAGQSAVEQAHTKTQEIGSDDFVLAYTHITSYPSASFTFVAQDQPLREGFLEASKTDTLPPGFTDIGTNVALVLDGPNSSPYLMNFLASYNLYDYLLTMSIESDPGRIPGFAQVVAWARGGKAMDLTDVQKAQVEAVQETMRTLPLHVVSAQNLKSAYSHYEASLNKDRATGSPAVVFVVKDAEAFVVEHFIRVLEEAIDPSDGEVFRHAESQHRLMEIKQLSGTERLQKLEELIGGNGTKLVNDAKVVAAELTGGGQNGLIRKDLNAGTVYLFSEIPTNEAPAPMTAPAIPNAP